MKQAAKSTIQIALWVVAVVTVIGIGLYYMPLEADHPSLMEALYSSLRLFVFERDLPTFPHAWPLIIIYFLAPLITVSVLGAAIRYLFRLSPLLKTWRLRDHIIVCGVGRTGKLIAEALQRRKVAVIGIDRGPAEDFEDWLAHHKIPLQFGDFHAHTVLEKARAELARSLVFCSGDDLANLEGAMAAYELLQTDQGPVRLIWAHIADDWLAETARTTMRTTGQVGLRFFDTYQIAAIHLIEAHFDRARRRAMRVVNLVGFGKFGFDLLETLLLDLAPTEQIEVRIIDRRDVAPQLQRLLAYLKRPAQVSFIQRDLRDLEIVEEEGHAYFLCTDNDLDNLSLALHLSHQAKSARIIVRMGHWPLSAVADRLGADSDITFVNLNELVENGLRDLPGLFAPATTEDLKRAITHQEPA